MKKNNVPASNEVIKTFQEILQKVNQKEKTLKKSFRLKEKAKKKLQQEVTACTKTIAELPINGPQRRAS